MPTGFSLQPLKSIVPKRYRKKKGQGRSHDMPVPSSERDRSLTPLEPISDISSSQLVTHGLPDPRGLEVMAAAEQTTQHDPDTSSSQRVTHRLPDQGGSQVIAHTIHSHIMTSKDQSGDRALPDLSRSMPPPQPTSDIPFSQLVSDASPSQLISDTSSSQFVGHGLSINNGQGFSIIGSSMTAIGRDNIVNNYIATSVDSENFKKLNVVVDAPYNSYARNDAAGCLKDTRVDIIDWIHQWIKTDGTLIFWLSGAAGMGKTTIAHSIAEACGTGTFPHASFFFSRDQQARRETRYLFQTIAFQLGNSFPALKPEIGKSLEDETLLTSNLRLQLRKLILEPISRISYLISGAVVIVLDALDECEEEDAVSLIIENLVAELKGSLAPLKFLVTSRPERHISSVFRSPEVHSNTRQFVLHEVSLLDVQKDIKAFLRHGLQKIVASSHDILTESLWPGEEKIDALVQISGGLFIAASTALKFINPGLGLVNPQSQLERILGNQTTSGRLNPLQHLDAIYAKILHHIYAQIPELATYGIQQSDVVKQFHNIVGTIILAYARLTKKQLAELLQVKEDVVSYTLMELQSVIHVPTNAEDPIHTFHLSFHDYLTDLSRCTNPEFYIDAPIHHTRIAKLCLQKMGSLKQDICMIQDSSMLNHEINGFNEKKEKFLPGDLQYACCYWGLHFAESLSMETLFQQFQSFMSTHLLNWIEVMSLIGKLGDGLAMIRKVYKKLVANKGTPSDLLNIAHDAERFIFEFYDVIAMSALHVYYVAFPFTPKKTTLYQTYKPTLQNIPHVVRGGSDNWNACLRTLIGHQGSISCVAISHDGTQIVSGSYDKTICIWNAKTGAVLHTLKGHSDFVNSVAISHDGTQIASGSDDNTVCVWNAKIGAILHTLKGHSDNANSVAFSHDGTQIVSGSDDKTICIWDAKTGAILHTLKGHLDYVRSVAISHDGTQIVSGSDNSTVCIWDAKTGVILHTLKGHSNYVTSVAISYDGIQIVSGSYDKTICIWDAKTGAILHTLKGHSNYVTSVAFSHDGTQIVSGSYDKTICIWDAKTGAILHALKGHSHWVNSVTISCDGIQIVSGSYDKTICIWDAKTGDILHALKGHSNRVNSVVISYDGTQIVSGSYDKTICIWDAQTGAILHTLEGHSDWVESIAISYDGTQIVSGSCDKTICIWDAHTGTILHTLKGHSDWVDSVAISHDGTQIVSGSHDNTVCIWDAKIGTILHTLKGHSNIVRSVAISHDGTQIVSGSYDNTVCIWNAKTGVILHTLKGHSDWVNSVAISYDGTQIVSGSHDKTICIWNAKTGAILHIQYTLTIIQSVTFSDNGFWVISDQGNYLIPLHIRPSILLPMNPQLEILPLTLKNDWLVKNQSTKVCWIPPAFQNPLSETVSTSLVVFGMETGEVVIIYIPPEYLQLL